MTSRTKDSASDPDFARRGISGALIYGGIAVLVAPPVLAQMTAPILEVWTGPSCSCCHDWIAHLRDNGFTVRSHDGGNQEARARLKMPVRFGSCHTGAIEGYAIEGHVPAREINRLLDERSDVVGLSVPAMPRGSPGMDGPAYNGVQDPYDVLLIGNDGLASVYQPYR